MYTRLRLMLQFHVEDRTIIVLEIEERATRTRQSATAMTMRHVQHGNGHRRTIYNSDEARVCSPASWLTSRPNRIERNQLHVKL